MKLVIGLGNPGKKYEATRHNVGFDTLRILAEKHAAETPRVKFESYVAEATIEGERTLLVWPQTYMNESGRAAKQAAAFYKISPEDLIVVCDDFNLPVGRLRVRPGGSAGGQNGLKSVASQLGSEAYPRLRIGVGPVPDGRDVVGFVLGRFGARERELIDVTLHDAAAAVACWLTRGVQATMNEFNSTGQA